MINLRIVLLVADARRIVSWFKSFFALGFACHARIEGECIRDWASQLTLCVWSMYHDMPVHQQYIGGTVSIQEY